MKKWIIMAWITTSIMIMTGCEEQTIVYKDHEVPINVIEDQIENELEHDNPGIDLEVDIYQDDTD